MTAVLMVTLASVVGLAEATEFDEKVKAPMVNDAAQLRSQAQSFGAKFAQLQDTPAEALVTDRALSRQRFDLSWQIQQAIDTRRPLGDLSSIGLESRDDGSYHIDLNQVPQWDRVDQLLVSVLPRMDWSWFGQQLVERGFREEDVSKLKAYVDAHDAHREAQTQLLPIALSFSKAVKKYDKLKLPVPDAVVLSYLYQRASVDSESTRAWTEALLKSLDTQRSRILLSYFSESPSSALWTPSDQAKGIADVLATVRRPNFEQIATAEAKGEAP